MIIFLEGGAATGGVGDDGVEVFAKKYGEILAGKFARGIANAGMRRERTAAKLAIRNDHFAAVGGEDTDGGFVELRKSNVGDTSSEESDAGAARTGGGERPAMAGVKKVIVDAREEEFAFGEAEKLQNADAAR